MNPEILNIIVPVVSAAIVALLMGIIRHLFKKGGLEFSERQWGMVQWALEDAVRYAEQKAIGLKKAQNSVEKEMPAEEKLNLAMELFNELADRNHHIKKYKTIAMPLIEAKVKEIFNKEVVA